MGTKGETSRFVFCKDLNLYLSPYIIIRYVESNAQREKKKKTTLTLCKYESQQPNREWQEVRGTGGS